MVICKVFFLFANTCGCTAYKQALNATPKDRYANMQKLLKTDNL